MISTDPSFREAVRSALAISTTDVSVELEIPVPFTEIADSHLERLRHLDADVVLLDLESDAQVGLKFAQFLVDSGMARTLIGAGRTDSPELLLSAMQAGISEFVAKPVTDESVQETVERALRKSGRKTEKAEQRQPGKVLPVFSAKGGSGSTAVSTNLAIEIHRLTRKRVLLVDLDLELGETALLLGIDSRFSVVDLMRNFHRVDSGLLASYIERHETGVELLSAPYQPADYEAVSAERVRQVLAFLREHYDYVVVDSPKTFNPATTVAFEDAEELYLVTTPDIPSLRNLTRSLPLLRSFGRRKPDSWIRLLVNRFDTKQVITRSEIEKTLGMEVFATLQNDYVAVMDSINAGKPAVMDGKSGFARDVRALAGKITGVRVEEPSGGWLASLISPFRNDRPAKRTPRKKKVKAHD